MILRKGASRYRSRRSAQKREYRPVTTYENTLDLIDVLALPVVCGLDTLTISLPVFQRKKVHWGNTRTRIWTRVNEDTGEVLGWERLDELQDEVWKRWDLGRHLRLFYFKYDMGPDWLEISFEAGKVEKKVHDRLLPFSAWEEFYSDLVKRLESKLDYPTLFSRVRPYLPRIDITFDIECEESERFIRSLHSLPMSLPLRRGFTASAQHIRAATKTAISEFSLYEPECEEGEPSAQSR